MLVMSFIKISSLVFLLTLFTILSTFLVRHSY